MASTSRRRRGAGNRRRAGGQVWPSPGEQGRTNAVPSPAGPANASYRHHNTALNNQGRFVGGAEGGTRAP